MSAQQCLLTVTDPRRTPELNRVFPFTLASVTYTLVGLRTIRNLIMQGLVYAMEDRSLGDYASYRSRGTSGPTVMRIGFSEFGNDAAVRQERKGTILHECIHAMQDNAAATWMRVDTAEAAAYTAQFLFLRACGRPRGVRSGIRFWGWAAAERIETLFDRFDLADDADRREFWKAVYADEGFMEFAGKFRPLLLSQENKLMFAAPWGPTP